MCLDAVAEWAVARGLPEAGGSPGRSPAHPAPPATLWHLPSWKATHSVGKAALTYGGPTALSQSLAPTINSNALNRNWVVPSPEENTTGEGGIAFQDGSRVKHER